MSMLIQLQDCDNKIRAIKNKKMKGPLKIQELEKAPVKDKEQIAIFEKIVTRSLFGNINASRNSA